MTCKESVANAIVAHEVLHLVHSIPGAHNLQLLTAMVEHQIQTEERYTHIRNYINQNEVQK